MTEEAIFKGLKEVISLVKPQLDLSTVSMDSYLVKDLGIDSLSMLMVSLAVEDKFKIRFDSPTPPQTVREVINYIQKVSE